MVEFILELLFAKIVLLFFSFSVLIPGFASADEPVSEYQKVVVENYVNGGNWLEFKLKNYDLDEDDKYFVECNVKETNEFSNVEVKQPEDLSENEVVSVILGPLEYETDYECSAGVADQKENAVYIVGRTDLIDITTLSSEESSKSDLTPSNVVEYDGTQPVNVSPRPFSLIDVSKDTIFKWDGPGKSDYSFSQYLICFSYLNKDSAASCFNAGDVKEVTITNELWFAVDQAVKTQLSSIMNEGKIDLKWYIHAWFRDGTQEGEEILTSREWVISYDNVFRGNEYDLNEIDNDLGMKEELKQPSYEKVEILSYEAGVNLIKLQVVNQNLEKGAKYFAECVNQEKKETFYDDLRTVELDQPAINDLTVELTVGPLFENTNYGCYAGIMIPDENTYGLHEPGVYAGYNVTLHSDSIYTFTLNAEKGEKVEFTVPPAGYEDEVLIAVEIYKNPFPDTNMNELSGKAAAELYRRAVLGGYPDGEFKGDRSVNRAEAAKFLLLARYKEVEELKNNGQFPDVLEWQWYTKFVVKAAQLGIIAGHPDGMFKPADGVNTAEFLKMLSLTFGIQENLEYDYADVDSSYWFAKYAGIAQKYDLFPNRVKNLEPGRYLTRDEVAVAIYQYLINRKK